jgi:hypothetical protein
VPAFYIDITSRDVATRAAEHIASGAGKEGLIYQVVEGASELTKQQARVMERNFINRYGLQKNGGQLLNKINSIAPKKMGSIRSRVVVGDVFAVSLGAKTTGFFQYVARDSSQLNSHVVRVFKERRVENEPADTSQIARGEIDFHAHVFLNLGVKQQLWRKVARADVRGSVDVVFRNSSDYGKSKKALSNEWFIWRINEPYVKLGALPRAYRDAEVGVVVPPDSLIYRMNNGFYDFHYPEPG